jgi:hypothetical protein
MIKNLLGAGGSGGGIPAQMLYAGELYGTSVTFSSFNTYKSANGWDVPDNAIVTAVIMIGYGDGSGSNAFTSITINGTNVISNSTRCFHSSNSRNGESCGNAIAIDTNISRTSSNTSAFTSSGGISNRGNWQYNHYLLFYITDHEVEMTSSGLKTFYFNKTHSGLTENDAVVFGIYGSRERYATHTFPPMTTHKDGWYYTGYGFGSYCSYLITDETSFTVDQQTQFGQQGTWGSCALTPA